MGGRRRPAAEYSKTYIPPWRRESIVTKRFTLYGSQHSLPTYKVALMLHVAGEPFSFRYVSFQKGMHRAPEFLALSRWGQVPVLIDGERVYLQSAAIVEHLAETLGRFQGPDPATRQAVREWLYWDIDALFPPVWIAMAFNSVSAGSCQFMSSLRLPSTIAGIPRRHCPCWIPNLPIATIFALTNQPSRIYSVAAMPPLPKSAGSTCVAGQTWPAGPTD
jgi:hypothetical protein